MMDMEVICAYEGDEAIKFVEEHKNKSNFTGYYASGKRWDGSL